MERITLPHGNFVVGDVIDPDKENANNNSMTNKINEVVDILNTFVTVDGEGNNSVDASGVQITPQAPFTESNVETLLSALIARLQATTVDASGAEFIGIEPITDVTATNLQDALVELKTLIGTGGGGGTGGTGGGAVGTASNIEVRRDDPTDLPVGRIWFREDL
jgi:hypothetical protein